MEILLKNQESCIINGGIASKYFRLEGGTEQGDFSIQLIVHIIVRICICSDQIKSKH